MRGVDQARVLLPMDALEGVRRLLSSLLDVILNWGGPLDIDRSDCSPSAFGAGRARYLPDALLTGRSPIGWDVEHLSAIQDRVSSRMLMAGSFFSDQWTRDKRRATLWT